MKNKKINYGVLGGLALAMLFAVPAYAQIQFPDAIGTPTITDLNDRVTELENVDTCSFNATGDYVQADGTTPCTEPFDPDSLEGSVDTLSTQMDALYQNLYNITPGTTAAEVEAIVNQAVAGIDFVVQQNFSVVNESGDEIITVNQTTEEVTIEGDTVVKNDSGDTVFFVDSSTGDVTVEGDTVIEGNTTITNEAGDTVFNVDGATGDTTIEGNTIIEGDTIVQNESGTTVFEVDNSTGNVTIAGDTINLNGGGITNDGTETTILGDTFSVTNQAGDTNYLQIDGSGIVSIGTTTPPAGSRLYVNGSIGATGLEIDGVIGGQYGKRYLTFNTDPLKCRLAGTIPFNSADATGYYQKAMAKVFGGGWGTENLAEVTYTFGVRNGITINKEIHYGTEDATLVPRVYQDGFDHHFAICETVPGWKAYTVRGWTLNDEAGLEETIVTDFDPTGMTDVTPGITLLSGGSSLWTQSGSDVSYTSGNVGIGTTSPGTRLHVDDNGAAGSLLQITSDDSGPWAFIVNNKSYNSGNSHVRSYMTNGGNWITRAAGTNSNDFTIAANGNIGIGTGSPTEKFQLNGGYRQVRNSNYDVWIQGGGGSGDNRNLAIIGFDEDNTDRLYINYGGEYAGGTVLGGNLRGSGSNGTLRINSGYGHLDIGPMNTSWSHFSTDRAKYYFNKEIRVNGSIGSYTGNLNLATAGTNRMYVRTNGQVHIPGRFTVGYDNLGSYTGYGKQYRAQIGSSSHNGLVVDSDASSSVGIAASGTSADFIAFGAGTNYASGSSIRWKENVEPIDDALEKVSQLRGVYFDWDEDHGGKHDIGLIAEEVREVLPEIVMTDPENTEYASGLDYGMLTPLLVEAVKAQQATIEELQDRIETLEAQL